MSKQITIKNGTYSAQTLASQTGLSLSTVYRRQQQGYSALDIIKEAAIMKKHVSAGSNWKKAAQKTEQTTKEAEIEIAKKETEAEIDKHSIEKILETRIEPKERKRVTYWEPADDYGAVSRLKVLGGWIARIDNEIMFVLDPKHKWEV